ncbi:MAG: hypothetical protein MJY81_02070 [Bacteroidaceae bacterium]|nr:hypothetical protein [Bacteroidaceae bacterium]
MKLIPKARPVRIRISSGGIEHSSLTSLKEHFSLEDVMGLIANGSLARWLRQCGESELAGVIECASENDKMEVLRAFFPELGKIKSEIELVKYLYRSGQEETAACLFNSDLINDINAIKQAWMYNIDGINYLPLFNEHWEEDGELAFLFARACAKGYFEIKDHSSVEMVLDKAIELGSRQAMEFQESDVWQEYIQSNDRFKNVDKKKMMYIINHILAEDEWIGHTGTNLRKRVEEVLGGKMPKIKTDQEKAIVKFVEECYYIVCRNSYGSHMDQIYKTFKLYKNSVAKDSILMPEILLINNIIGGSWHDLREYVDVSPLADLYVNSHIIQKLSLRDTLKFILEHLFDDKIEV